MACSTSPVCLLTPCQSGHTTCLHRDLCYLRSHHMPSQRPVQLKVTPHAYTETSATHSTAVAALLSLQKNLLLHEVKQILAPHALLRPGCVGLAPCWVHQHVTHPCIVRGPGRMLHVQHSEQILATCMHIRLIHIRSMHIRSIHIRSTPMRLIHIRSMHIRPMHIRSVHIRLIHEINARPVNAHQANAYQVSAHLVNASQANALQVNAHH